MTRVLSALVLLPVVIGTIWFLPAAWPRSAGVESPRCWRFASTARSREALGVSVPGGIGASPSCWSLRHVAGDRRGIGRPSDAACFMSRRSSIGPPVGVHRRGSDLGRPRPPGARCARRRRRDALRADLHRLAARRAGLGARRSAGREAVLLLLAVIVVSDSAQYYTGRAFGRRPLAPTISPKKTVEGAIGGMVFGTLAMAVGGQWVFRVTDLDAGAARRGDFAARHRRRSLRVAAQAQRRHEGFLAI